MIYSLTWMPEVLRKAGLKVAECDGWRDRGRAPMGKVAGVVCHHTATAKPGNMPTLRMLIDGRSDLEGPLSQLGLGRDGTYYIVAAGRANHGGPGEWKGLAGNARFIGIEAENSGAAADPWPAAQTDAYVHGVAAILTRIGASADMCCGHKEYARPLGRKSDPSFAMGPFRDRVRAVMAGQTPRPTLIAAHDAQNRPTMMRGDRGDPVKLIQQKLNLPADRVFGAATEAAVRKFQRTKGLVPDGIVGPATWADLDSLP